MQHQNNAFSLTVKGGSKIVWMSLQFTFEEDFNFVMQVI